MIVAARAVNRRADKRGHRRCYHVITVNPEKWQNVNLDGAQAFADFVTSPEGQNLIGEFGVDKYGQPLFIPDADKTDEELGLQ